MMQIRTPSCIVCNESSRVTVTDEEFHALVHARELIQDALPNRDADFRELLLTGTHAECWKTLARES